MASLANLKSKDGEQEPWRGAWLRELSGSGGIESLFEPFFAENRKTIELVTYRLSGLERIDREAYQRLARENQRRTPPPKASRRGRPKGTGRFANVEQFAREYKEKSVGIRERTGNRPTQYELASELCLSRAQFNVYLSRYREENPDSNYPDNSSD